MVEITTMSCGCHEYRNKNGFAHNLYGPALIKKGSQNFCQSINIYAINGQYYSKEEFENLPSSTFNNAEE